MKVVIVEDEIRIREGVIKLLNKFYRNIEEIHDAKSAEEGLAVIRRVSPDLVITDIRMEHMDGLAMLNILLNQEGRAFKTIILSAYSEFEYARQAISLGVSEYLVKPVEVGAFRQAMQRVETELEKERLHARDNPRKLGSLEAVCAGLLSSQLTIDDEIERYMEKAFHVAPEDPFAMICIYMGRRYGDKAPLLTNIVQSELVKAGFEGYFFVEMPQSSEVLFIFDKRTDFQKLERHLQYGLTKVLNTTSTSSAVLGFVVSESLNTIRESYMNLRAHLPWSISLGSGVVISYPKIKQVRAAAASYPVHIEKESIEALCAMDYHRLNLQAESFLRSLTESAHSPEYIKKSVVRYLLAILAVVKEINYQAYEGLDEGRILEAAVAAVAYDEIESVIFGLLETLMRPSGKSMGLLVQKVARMVEEFYHQGITLEEISASLNLSPEHISAQFVRELGVNFSTYIKNHRLIRAKELLLGTDLKLYEIASRVGYSDAKYFSRVFRESEGVLPAEYRKRHR